MIAWLLVHAGLTSPNSVWYLFFSGIGADALRLLFVTGIWGGFIKLHRQRERHHAELTELDRRRNLSLKTLNERLHRTDSGVSDGTSRSRRQ